ncbi:uncharacterized protein [Triticum aestivum]|uniref:uncharacterized protein n=1 Tax=Triticum aestivum TaxID=4565 RepID=UPI001D022A92|nr:uncharacterized protein LOC123163702 [Triticum aestivum]
MPPVRQAPADFHHPQRPASWIRFYKCVDYDDGLCPLFELQDKYARRIAQLPPAPMPKAMLLAAAVGGGNTPSTCPSVRMRGSRRTDRKPHAYCSPAPGIKQQAEHAQASSFARR